MLPLVKLDAALESCKEEAFWMPSYAGGVLAVPLLDEGVSGGVHIEGYKQRRAYQALVVAVNGTKHVKVGDLVCFDMGRTETLTTYRGEVYLHTTERLLSGVDEEFGKEPEPPPGPTQLPSGIWIS